MWRHVAWHRNMLPPSSVYIMQLVGFTEMLIYICHTIWSPTSWKTIICKWYVALSNSTQWIILNTFPPVKQMKISVSEQCINSAMVSTWDLPNDLLISTVIKKINTFNSQQMQSSPNIILLCEWVNESVTPWLSRLSVLLSNPCHPSYHRGWERLCPLWGMCWGWRNS